MSAVFARKKLGDVLRIQNGYAFDSQKFSTSGRMPLIRIRDLKNGVETETRYDGTYDEKYLVHAGDLLVGMDGEFGCYEWKGEPALLNQRVCRLQDFKDDVSPRFLLYGIQSHLKSIEDVTGFATVKHLSSRQVLDIDFPLPAFTEQQRIVKILDEAFSEIATVKTFTEQNLRDTDELFDSYLQFIFGQRDNLWVDTMLQDVCRLQNGFAFKSRSFKPFGSPIIRISNIQSGKVDTNKLVFFEPKDYREKLDKYLVNKGDLLIAMSGATTGKLGINTTDTVFYLNQRVGKFEIGSKLNKHFLYYYLYTKVEENLHISAGSAQPNLSTEQVKNFVLPLPPIKIQEDIVRAISSFSEEISSLSKIYRQKLEKLEGLKQSLLHQAFTGQL